MTDYTITERVLDEGDVVELGKNIIESETERTQRGSLRLIAASTGERTEYVLLRTHAGDGESVHVPDGGSVFAVTAGKGMASPEVWYVVPTEAYGE